MTRPPFAFGDLYVVQARCGLVKIGRSTDPERRLCQLVRLVNQPMKLVLVLPGQGHEEDRVLKGLSRRGDIPIAPEWFLPSAVRDRLPEVLPVKLPRWPFLEKHAELCALIAKLQANAFSGHQTRLRNRVIAEIRSGEIHKSWPGSLASNDRVRQAISHEYCLLMVRGKFVRGRRYDDPVVDCLGSMESARTIGPPGWEPPQSGTVAETVVAGLRALTSWEKEMANED